MRAPVVIVIAILMLGFGYDPVRAGASAYLARIHMIDALTGWGVGAEYYGGPAPIVDARGFVELLLHTTDGGIHWRDVTPPNPPGQQMRRVYSIDVLNSLITWISATPTTPGAAVLFHTVDGGQTWKHVTVPDLNWWGVPPVDFINARDGWFISYEGAVYRSTDGGDTWVKVASVNSKENSSRSFWGIESITFLDAATGLVTGSHASDFVYLHVTRDSGYTWRRQKLPSPSLGIPNPSGFSTLPPKFFTAQDGVLPVEFFVSNESHTTTIALGVVFYVTRDGGTTWTPTTPPYVPFSQWFRGSSFADVDHGWVVDIGGALYMTGDGGRHWTKIEPTPLSSGVRQIDFISPQIGWAVSEGPPWLQKTADGGRTWAPMAYTISRQ